LSFCVPEKVMSVVDFSLRKHLSRLRWPTVAGSMLVALLAAHTVMAYGGRGSMDGGTGAQASNQAQDFLPSQEKNWVSTANVYKRAHAATADHVDVAPGAYFHALTRIYGASIDLHQPGQINPTAQTNEPMPLDEVAKFHQMETHMPIAMARVTSEFGHRANPLGKGHVFHRGIDLAAPVGTPVYAVAAGTVIKSIRDRSYGNVVVINHHNGYKTLYAHNSKLLVKVGEKVKAGQPIAKVGSTGHSTGPHLHFEIHRSGERVDPGPYLAAL
jgi:murein DD-endopeptidase MepM/ murein hydrolase activator NlpD